MGAKQEKKIREKRERKRQGKEERRERNGGKGRWRSKVEVGKEGRPHGKKGRKGREGWMGKDGWERREVSREGEREVE